MIEILEKEKCCGCHGCQNICPKNCISMEVDNEGFWYPNVNKDVCIDCHLCEKVCPVLENPKKENFDSIAYAAKSFNDSVREQSSSGGIFSILCEKVISEGGVVFGAAFDEGFEVRHTYAESLDECNQFRGSKYVQSKIGETYKQVRKFLTEGRIVLFTGTQCQIKGLNLFLRKKYDNLIAVDIICHGVPSPKVFRDYRELLEKKYNSTIDEIWFRRKDEGWKKFSFAVRFKSCEEYVQSLVDDTFMKGFLSDLYLRPSCYSCSAKNFINNSDLSLADYWGVDGIHPELDDDKGTSLVIVNTEKGREIFDSIKNNMQIVKSDIEYAKNHNKCIVKPVDKHPRRQAFFDSYDKEKLEQSIEKYRNLTILQKLIKKGKKIINIQPRTKV